MTTDIRQVPEDNLPPRQRTFLDKLRQHDKKVVVLRDGGALLFRGPVIGEGPMPPDHDDPAEAFATDADD
jgi:hypothetical protein